MSLTSGVIVGMIMSLVFVTVLFNMLPGILPGVITSVNNLYNTSNLGDATLVGSAPAAFAANVSSYTGWFWNIGPFVLVVGAILALFLRKR